MSNKPTSDAALVFKCFECGNTVPMEQFDDPTTSSGCCKGCGGNNWKIFDSLTKEIIVN